MAIHNVTGGLRGALWNSHLFFKIVYLPIKIYPLSIMHLSHDINYLKPRKSASVSAHHADIVKCHFPIHYKKSYWRPDVTTNHRQTKLTNNPDEEAESPFLSFYETMNTYTSPVERHWTVSFSYKTCVKRITSEKNIHFYFM